MKIKQNLKIGSSNFWYDLCEGYLAPSEICECTEDVIEVEKAVQIILNFQRSCEEQIEGFIQ